MRGIHSAKGVRKVGVEALMELLIHCAAQKASGQRSAGLGEIRGES